MYDARQDPVVKAFSERLRDRLGSNLCQVILYGSRARGDADEDSDYDYLVVVQSLTKEIKKVIDAISYEMLDTYDALLSAIPVTQKDKTERIYNPLYMNISKEGIET